MSILGDEERVVGPGDILHIPRDTRHGATTLSEKCVSIIIKSPAGSGVLGEDYNEAKDADDVIRRLSENLGEDVKY
jgi:quercetin dioxygenase-like cupin family protein